MAVIDDITRRYRDALIARERTAEAALLEAYALIWERIEPEALALADRIAAAIEAGEEISPSWLYRQERYRILSRQIESEINAMTAGFGATVTQLQAEAAVLGVDMSLSTLAVQGVQGLVRLPNDKLIDMVGRLSDGSPLRSLLDDLGPDASRRVRESLLTGIGEGQGPREIARRMRDALGGNMARAMTIARTEVVGVHRRAALAQMSEYSHLLEGWRWVASLDNTNPPPCAACIAMHGTTFPISTPFESHQNCFIAGTVVSGPKVIGSTERWYSGPVVEVVTAFGNRFTVTPNHPILTPDGWVAAGLLDKGSKVISAPLSERPFGQIDPDEYQVPALIEDVVRSVGGAASVSTRRVPTAAVDFHGDGIGSEVHIVRADSLLSGSRNPAIHQPSLYEQFGGRDVSLFALTGGGTLAKRLERAFSPTRSSVGSLDIAGILLGRTLRHHQPVGLGQSSAWNTRLIEPASDHNPVNVVALRNRILRFAGKVAPDDLVSIKRNGGIINPQGHAVKPQDAVDHFRGDAMSASEFRARYAGFVGVDEIVNIRRVPWSGHVYNLHTSENWYNANGIIAHNCRCVPSPVTINSRVDWGPPGEDWFAGQSPEYQQSVLAPSKYRAYAAGEIRLSDLVAKGHSAEWGGWRREASLRQAIGASRARQFYQQAAD
jgi:hypothetical protein